MNFCVVGNNLYGQIFVRALRSIGEIASIAICPELDESLEPLSSQYQLKPYPDLQTALGVEKPDAVILASITALHAEQASMAIQAGAHVLVDRPIAVDLDACDHMIASASTEKRILMTGHVLQFWPEYVAIRNILKNSELSNLKNISAYRISGTLNPGWLRRLTNPEFGLGGLEAHIHDIDLLNNLIGIPESVYARGTRNQDGGWTQVHSTLSYHNQVNAAVEANYSVPLNFPLSMHLKLVGEEGALVYTFQGALAAQKSAHKSLMQFKNGVDPEEIRVPITDSYLEMVRHFVACIREDRQPEWGTPAQARQALAVVLAVARSATIQQPVFLSSIESAGPS